MDTKRAFSWRLDVALPLAVLALPVLIGVLTMPDGRGLLVALPVSLIVGYRLRPKHVWLIWLATTLMFVVGVVVGEWAGLWSETAGADAEIPVSMSLLFIVTVMALLVLLPLWFGRFIAYSSDRDRAAIRRRQAHQTPGEA